MRFSGIRHRAAPEANLRQTGYHPAPAAGVGMCAVPGARLSHVTPSSRALCRQGGTQRVLPAWLAAGAVPAVLVGALILEGCLAGCASPGLPHPPSLMLPERVSDLRAERVGDAVLLHWTSPSETTDHIALRGSVSAEVCRDLLPAVSSSGQVAAAPSSCTVVQTLPSPAGDREATDPLPPGLLREPVRVMAYRVVLRNSEGHSAGPSAAVLVASGAAPPSVAGLQAHPAAEGVALTWTPGGAETESAVQLLRSPPAGQPGRPTRPRGAGMTARLAAPSPRSSAGPVRLLAVPAGVPDRGGAVDATAERGHTYVYQAVRVRTVTVAGASLTLRSAESAPVTALVQDIAPPAVPAELVLATDGLAVDLSWQPGFEPDLAGYVVYRSVLPRSAVPRSGSGELSAARWERLTPTPVALPAFHDTLPHAGHFAYRVTAMDRSGNESAASVPALARGDSRRSLGVGCGGVEVWPTRPAPSASG